MYMGRHYGINASDIGDISDVGDVGDVSGNEGIRA
jgi:hypothetical protein